MVASDPIAIDAHIVSGVASAGRDYGVRIVIASR